MAFDIILSNDVPWSRTILLSLVAVLTGCPAKTFVTEKAYRSMLLTAGYKEDGIQIKDVSEFVFKPLAEYMDEREKTLEAVGWGLGKLKAAKWLFGWWAKSAIVKGVIVIARR